MTTLATRVGLALSMALTGVALQPHAQAAPPVADPTQPAAAATSANGSGHGKATAEAPPTWPQLQSVQVSASGTRSAIIDGRVLRVGERVGELTLVAIDTDGILLRGERYEQRLALVPGIAKTASSGGVDAVATGTAPAGGPPIPAISPRPALTLAAKDPR